jgi:hypothetical protein
MLIAQQKLKENIAEYILYMYQIEDVIRSYHFDLDKIMNEYAKPQLPDNSFFESYKAWYDGLIRGMKSQKIEEKGHLHIIQEVMIELSYLHNTLLNIANDEKYKGVYERASDAIQDFREKSNLKDKNDVELVFHAMYMKLLLRLQKKQLNTESEEAFDNMRVMIAYLSRAYHNMKNGNPLS